MMMNGFCCSIYAYITNVGTTMDTCPITALDVDFTFTRMTTRRTVRLEQYGVRLLTCFDSIFMI